jgi:hypothetical protein
MDDNSLIGLSIIFIVFSINCYKILSRRHCITIIQVNNIEENLKKRQIPKNNLTIDNHDYSKDAAMWF